MSIGLNTEYNLQGYGNGSIYGYGTPRVQKDRKKEDDILDDLSKRFKNADISVGNESSFPIKGAQKEFSVIFSEDEMNILKNGSDDEKEKLYKTIESSIKTLTDLGEKLKDNKDYGKFDLGLSINNGNVVSYLADDGKNSYSAGSIDDFIKEISNRNKEQYNETEYSLNKKSKTERDSIVKQMKADAEQRQQQLMSMVKKMISGQAGAYGKATGDDFWKMLSSGNFTVDPATRAQAQKDISEDGYWGVKKTSQRLFDFASALAGDDVDKMKEMQSAIEKGFKMAAKSWGKELPGICKDTFDATNKLFDEYYRSKGVTE